MTKTLTEQWKNGELEEGYYYVKVNDIENIVLDEYCRWYSAKEKPKKEFTYGASIEEVLRPVPTLHEYDELLKKIDKLKKQLKEANMVIKRELRRQSPKDGVLLGDMNDYLEKWGVK